jgi:hypothetical protein
MTDDIPAVSPLPPLDLDAICARAGAATPGPWMSWMPASTVTKRDGNLDVIAAKVFELGDLVFIANARADVPALVAEVGEHRARPVLTAEEAAQILNWSYIIAAKHYTQFPDRADALLAKLGQIAGDR